MRNKTILIVIIIASIFFIKSSYSKSINKIAFTSRVGDHTKIYSMNSDGSNLKLLTKLNNVDESHPSWSPMGK